MVILGLSTALELIDLALIGIGPGAGDPSGKGALMSRAADGVESSNVIVRQRYEKIVWQTPFHADLSERVRRHCHVRGHLTPGPGPDATRCERVRPAWIIDLDFVYPFPIELGKGLNLIEIYQLEKIPMPPRMTVALPMAYAKPMLGSPLSLS